MSQSTRKLQIFKLFQKSKKFSIKWSSYFQVYEKKNEGIWRAKERIKYKKMIFIDKVKEIIKNSIHL